MAVSYTHLDTEAPISVPVGQQVLGRMFNVLGDEIDGLGELPEPNKKLPIHRAAPSFEEPVSYTHLFCQVTEHDAGRCQHGVGSDAGDRRICRRGDRHD